MDKAANDKKVLYLKPLTDTTSYDVLSGILTGSGEDWQVGED